MQPTTIRLFQTINQPTYPQTDQEVIPGIYSTNMSPKPLITQPIVFFQILPQINSKYSRGIPDTISRFYHLPSALKYSMNVIKTIKIKAHIVIVDTSSTVCLSLAGKRLSLLGGCRAINLSINLSGSAEYWQNVSDKSSTDYYISLVFDMSFFHSRVYCLIEVLFVTLL